MRITSKSVRFQFRSQFLSECHCLKMSWSIFSENVYRLRLKLGCLSHRSLECHHRNNPGSPSMHSKLSAGGKTQGGRQGSQWWGQEWFGPSAKNRTHQYVELRHNGRYWSWNNKLFSSIVPLCALLNTTTTVSCSCFSEYSQWPRSIQPREGSRWWWAESRSRTGQWPGRWLCMGL